MSEIWKPVVGYEGLYEVSNLGRVKSLPRNGTTKTGTILSDSCNGNGYRKLRLCNTNKRTFYVHILVAMAFLDYKPNKNVVCVDHINCIRSDNNLINLRILSHRSNILRATKSNTGYNGIYKVRDKFRVLIMKNKKSFHVGYFNDIESAKKAYQDKFNQLTKNEEL
jgi:hypothetical protein